MRFSWHFTKWYDIISNFFSPFSNKFLLLTTTIFDNIMQQTCLYHNRRKMKWHSKQSHTKWMTKIRKFYRIGNQGNYLLLFTMLFLCPQKRLLQYQNIFWIVRHTISHKFLFFLSHHKVISQSNEKIIRNIFLAKLIDKILKKIFWHDYDLLSKYVSLIYPLLYKLRQEISLLSNVRKVISSQWKSYTGLFAKVRTFFHHNSWGSTYSSQIAVSWYNIRKVILLMPNFWHCWTKESISCTFSDVIIQDILIGRDIFFIIDLIY